MSRGPFTATGPGRFALAGHLDFDTVPRLLACGSELLASDRIELDLAGVNSSNSAGLALLLEWRAQALRQGKHLLFKNIPQQLLQIAGLSELADYLQSAD